MLSLVHLKVNTPDFQPWSRRPAMFLESGSPYLIYLFFPLCLNLTRIFRLVFHNGLLSLAGMSDYCRENAPDGKPL